MLLLEVDVAEVEADCLRAPEARRVDELQQGAVAQGEGAVAAARGLDQVVDLGGLRRLREPAAAARGERHFRHLGGPECEAQQRAHRGQSPRDRRR